MLLASCLCGAGCASTATLPPSLANPAAHPAYPPSEYITAVGMSDLGFDQAGTAAKLKVSEQVRSSIASSYEQHMTEEFNKVSLKIKKDTQFSHAEMIRIDVATAAKVGQLYYAFAYLSRREMSGVLNAEYEKAAVVFRRACASLPGLEGDLPAYTAALRQAQDSFATLAAKSFEIRAVTLQEPATFQKDTASFLAMESGRVNLLRSLKLTVTVDNVNYSASREVILMGLTGALTRLGLEATPGACSPQKYALKTKADIACSRAAFGPQCVLRLAGALEHCASGKVLAELDLNSPNFKGVNTRAEDKALTDLYSTITPDALTPLLAKGLRGVLPIDEPAAEK